MMSDLISRQAAIDAVEFGITYAKAINKETGEVKELFQASNDELRKAEDRIKQLPSAQPDYDLSGYSDRLWKAAYERGKAEAQRTGRWVTIEGRLKCSACGFGGKIVPFNFCPNCGARMEVEE